MSFPCFFNKILGGDSMHSGEDSIYPAEDSMYHGDDSIEILITSLVKIACTPSFGKKHAPHPPSSTGRI